MRGLTYRRGLRRLDCELAAGSDPDRDRRLRRRAREITGARFRHRLAERLERLVRQAEGSPAWQSPVRWSEVREFSILIVALAESLSAPIRVSPQGVARAVVLLEDGTSALYGPGPEGELAIAVRSALRCLEIGPRLDHDGAGAPSPLASTVPTAWAR